MYYVKKSKYIYIFTLARLFLSILNFQEEPMPVISITVSGKPVSTQQHQDLQQKTTQLMAQVMGKHPSVTAVLVQSLPSSNWAIGGHALDDHQRGAHMDITITTGTNTTVEKTVMIEAAYRMLTDVLGPLPEASYVVIHEVAADAWGYGGVTQRSRQGMSLSP
jgi:4-oxalocrotonate tautomerase